jgi:hypothetical protein
MPVLCDILILRPEDTADTSAGGQDIAIFIFVFREPFLDRLAFIGSQQRSRQPSSIVDRLILLPALSFLHLMME